MNKIGLIIKREYLRRVSKKSFILLTLLTPFLFAALVFVPLWLSTIKGDEVRNVAIIDTTGKYASLFENNESFHFIHSDKTLDEYRQGEDKEVFAFLSITDDLLNNPKAATLYSEKQVPAELSRLVNQTLSKQLESEKLASFNIPNLKEIIRESKINFNVQTIKWSEDGKESASSATVASIIGMVFTFIIYMFIMMYGAMVMQGVMEEKTNRIIEVMISSVRPFDLMMGKIIGIGFVGLTQVFLWGIITTILVSVGGFMFSGGVDVASLQAGPQMGIMDANQYCRNRYLFYYLFHWRLYVVCIHIRGYRLGGRQPGRYPAVYGSGHDLYDLCAVCRYLQYGESGRTTGILVFDGSVHFTDRHDGTYSF